MLNHRSGKAELKKAQATESQNDRERDYIAAIGAFYQDGKLDQDARASAYPQAMEGVYRVSG